MAFAEAIVSGLALHAVSPASMLEPLGPVAAEQHAHLLRVTALTALAVIPVLLGVPLLLWRYRYRQGGGAYRPDWDFNKRLEIAMWGVPVVIILCLAAALVYSTTKLDPERPLGANPLKIQVIGLDWKWVFIYPEQGVATINSLVVPVNRPIELSMTSDTVMQSLMVPALFGQAYSMPGMVTRMNFSAERPGQTTGMNMQYNGAEFSRQQFAVRIVTAAQFAAWAGGARTSLRALDAASYARIAVPGTGLQALAALGPCPSGGCGGSDAAVLRLADPNLFGGVVGRNRGGAPMRDMAPAAMAGPTR